MGTIHNVDTEFLQGNGSYAQQSTHAPLRFLLVSNMYPGRHHLFFGAFIKNIESGLRENGLHVDRIVIAGKSRNLFEKIWKYAVFYWRLFTAPVNRYDVVQLSYPSHTYFPFLFRKLKKPILVVRLHGLDLLGGEQEGRKHLWMSRLFTRPAVMRADLVVVPSQYFLEELKQRFRVRDTFVCPSGGVDLTLFRPMNRPEDSPPTVGYVGRLDVLKGVDVLLKAVSLAKTPFRLLIVGDGRLAGKYRKMARKLGLEDRTVFRGPVLHTQLVREYHAMDVLAFPTMRKAESFGNVAIEAMACGIPVVGSRIAGLSEYMKDGENGFLVPPEDAEALASTLDLFFQLDPDRRQKMKDAALDTAKRFERNRVSRGYIDKLHMILSGRARFKSVR